MKTTVKLTMVTTPANETLKREAKTQHYVIIGDDEQLVINIGKENFDKLTEMEKKYQNGNMDTTTISQPETKTINVEGNKSKR